MAGRSYTLAGFGAGIFYLTGDIIGGFITPDYSFIRNAVSELIQTGAPHRLLLSPLLFLHAVMVILFAAGFLSSSDIPRSGRTRVGGILLLMVGASSALTSTIFPMDPVGAAATFPGIMHLILVGISVLSIMVVMPLLGSGLHGVVPWKRFKLFTFICLAVIVLSGFSTPVIIDQGIELMGLTERITVYTLFIWLGVLALQLRERMRTT